MKPIQRAALLLALALALVATAIQAQRQVGGTAPAGKLHVMIIEETSQRGQLPKEQLSVLTGQSVRDYCKTHCATDTNGTPAFRKFDVEDDLSQEAADWRAVFGKKGSTLPWIIISNGKQSFNGPLPAGVDETLKLLAKYGGQ